MDLYKLVVAMKLTKGGGGGDDPTIIDPLTVNANGVYSASSGHAFDPVTVSVPSSGITPTGTKNIEANGDYDVTSFASAHVAVPSALMSAINITENGTYVPSGSVSGFNQVTVNVSGGGGGSDAEDGIIQRTISGVYENSRVTKIGSSAFISCTSLTSVSFPNATSIGGNAFRGCSGLTTANFSNATEIGDYAFYSCTSLTSVSFPNATSIGGSAFSGCSRLTALNFPKVTNISGGAFYNCSRLTAAYFLASSVATLGAAAFANTPMSNSTYTGSFGSIYVPASLVYSYRTASNWSSYYYRITSYVE